MCLHTLQQSPLIAEEDIIVYKVLTYSQNPDSYVSNTQGFPYELGKEYYTEQFGEPVDDPYGGGYIWDADNRMVGETRGWGYLQKLKDGAQVQDNVGKLIVELLNQKYEQIKAKNPK